MAFAIGVDAFAPLRARIAVEIAGSAVISPVALLEGFETATTTISRHVLLQIAIAHAGEVRAASDRRSSR